MLEGIVLGLFAAAILSCALTGHTVIWALIAGFFLFSGYGLFRGHGLKALGAMASKGVRTIMGIVIVMALIGMLTLPELVEEICRTIGLEEPDTDR